jgi:hypothetical protein
VRTLQPRFGQSTSRYLASSRIITAFAYVWWMPNDVATVPPDKGKRRGKSHGPKSGRAGRFHARPALLSHASPWPAAGVGLN